MRTIPAAGASPVLATKRPSTSPTPSNPRKDVQAMVMVGDKSQSTPVIARSHSLSRRANPHFRDHQQSAQPSPLSETAVPMFGTPLAVLLQSENAPEVLKRRRGHLPRTLVKLVHYLNGERVLETPGLFRSNGSTLKIQELRQSMELNPNMTVAELSEDVIHAMASLLKQYLSEIPGGLIPNNVRISLWNVCTRAEDMAAVVAKLEDANYFALRYVLLLMKRSADRSDKNQMSAVELCQAFAPCVFPQQEDPAQDSQDSLPLIPDQRSVHTLLTMMNHFQAIFTAGRMDLTRQEERLLLEAEPAGTGGSEHGGGSSPSSPAQVKGFHQSLIDDLKQVLSLGASPLVRGIENQTAKPSSLKVLAKTPVTSNDVGALTDSRNNKSPLLLPLHASGIPAVISAPVFTLDTAATGAPLPALTKTRARNTNKRKPSISSVIEEVASAATVKQRSRTPSPEGTPLLSVRRELSSLRTETTLTPRGSPTIFNGSRQQGDVSRGTANRSALKRRVAPPVPEVIKKQSSNSFWSTAVATLFLVLSLLPLAGLYISGDAWMDWMFSS